LAAQLEASYSDQDAEVIDPVLVAWYDRKAARMSPAIEGDDLHSELHFLFGPHEQHDQLAGQVIELCQPSLNVLA
jgi:hypothetical protein